MINSDKSIVAFLDILGYEQWLQRHTPEEARRAILRHFKAIEEGGEHESSPFKLFFKSIAIHSLSDSLILVLPESDNLEHAFPGLGKKASREFSIKNFLGIVAWIAFHLTSDTKSLIRGAVTFGQYYQHELNTPANQFVFSKALHKASYLERQANMPRIIVEDVIQKDILAPEDVLTFRDEDGQYCLDLYTTSIQTHVASRERYLGEITSSLKEQWAALSSMERVRQERILQKLFWFTNYHNRSIDELFRRQEITDPARFKIELPV